MKKLILISIVLLQKFAFSQTKNISLGDSSFVLEKSCYNLANPKTIFINVHSNEVTSKLAAINFLQTKGGCFIQLYNSEKRNISFNIKKQIYTVDPNRIFTAKGIKASLKKNSTYNKHAEKIAKKLADSIISTLTHENPKLVIAMHNNTNEEYSIKSYLPNGSEAPNTADIYINEEMDEDDFVYATTPKIFNFLKEKKINVILQKQKNFVNDGSLSAYCTFAKIDYLNVEAQAGHLQEQLNILEAVKEIMSWYK